MPGTHNGERIGPLISGAEKTGIHIQKNETGPYLTPHTKINSNCIKELNTRPETAKLVEESIGKKLNISLDNFLYTTSKVHTTKAKIDK